MSVEGFDVEKRVMRFRQPRAVVVLALIPAWWASAGSSAAQGSPAFHLRSDDFAGGGPIPSVHEANAFGCTGRNVPPTLTWSGAPRGARSFALTMIDSDAPAPGGFVHWVVYNISGRRRTLGPASLKGTRQGRNDAGITGYTGPCPPPGSGPHHYHFTLYALDLRSIAPAHLAAPALRHAIKGHILARATLIGTFKRPGP